MTEHIHKTIEAIQATMIPLEEQLNKKREMVNQLCDLAGIPHLYDIQSPTQTVSGPSLAIKNDQFYGQPLNTCIRTFLQMRKTAGQGTATAEEIYDTLKKGGYAFSINDKDEALKGLRITLGKSTQAFTRLPDGSYGLSEWYGVKSPKPKPSAQGSPQQSPASGQSTAGQSEQPEEEADNSTQARA